MHTSLTEEFKRKRTNFHRKSFLDEDDMNEEKDDDTPLITRDDVSLMMNRPMWMIIRDDVENDFDTIAQCLGELRETQDSVLRDTMGKHSDKLNSRIELICANISRRIRETSKKIEQIRRTDGVSSDSEANVRESVSRSLAMRTRRILNEFKESRNQFVQKLSYLRSPATAGQTNLDDLIQTFNQMNSEENGKEEALRKSSRIEYDADNDWLLQRDKEITKIVRSVAELSDMFYEASVMIGEQGSVLDRIDFNMECAVDTSKKGVLELEKAEEHQKNSKSLKCIAILVVTIVVLVFVLILKKM